MHARDSSGNSVLVPFMTCPRGYEANETLASVSDRLWIENWQSDGQKKKQTSGNAIRIVWQRKMGGTVTYISTYIHTHTCVLLLLLRSLKTIPTACFLYISTLTHTHTHTHASIELFNSVLCINSKVHVYIWMLYDMYWRPWLYMYLRTYSYTRVARFGHFEASKWQIWPFLYRLAWTFFRIY